jgi:Zn ribbon nucleic-acid-binding protein
MNHFACAVVDDTLKIWSPKDVEEVKCVIKNLRNKKIHRKKYKYTILLYSAKLAQ